MGLLAGMGLEGLDRRSLLVGAGLGAAAVCAWRLLRAGPGTRSELAQIVSVLQDIHATLQQCQEALTPEDEFVDALALPMVAAVRDVQLGAADDVLERADELRDQKDMQQAADLLISSREHVAQDAELFWRLARAYYDLAELDGARKEEYLKQGYSYGQQAVAADERNADAQRWCAVLAGSQAEFAELKEKVRFGQLFKEHIEKAIALRPEDPYCHHLLGRWCFEIASLSWFERKACSAFIGTLPDVSFAEVLRHFSKAEELQPGFYKSNLIFLAKTSYKLSEYDQTKFYYAEAIKLANTSSEDSKFDAEARKYLGM